MSADPRSPLLDHEYDGIAEYDNPIPGWWNWLFAASVCFAVLYFMYFHIGTISSTIEEDWQQAQLAEFKRVFGKLGELKPDRDTILRMKDDRQMMAIARGIFIGNCAACHAKDGGGINGVNLTDDSYKNIHDVEDFFQVISKGANNGAMPAWENRLPSNERIIMAAYAMSLRGTTPATAKPPEGSAIPPFPTRPADAGAAEPKPLN